MEMQRTLEYSKHFFFLVKIWNTSQICVSNLHRSHANLRYIIPILAYVLPWMDDPFKEVHLTQLNEAYILWVLVEILAAHIEAIGFISRSNCVSMSRRSKQQHPGQISSDAPAELLVTHLAFSDATRQKEGHIAFLTIDPLSIF